VPLIEATEVILLRRLSQTGDSRKFGEIIGDSPALKTALNLVSLVAPTDSSVMIQGETGAGKELIARAIHDLSGRRERLCEIELRRNPAWTS
jgi:transcriptional regulator with GAF, ATPase, and Fis domain